MIANLLNNECEIFYNSSLNEYSEIIAGTPTKTKCRIGEGTTRFNDAQGDSSIYDICLHLLPETEVKRGHLINILGKGYVVEETTITRDVSGNPILIFAYLKESYFKYA